MERLIKAKIKALYPDADFSSVSENELEYFAQLIQERLTKCQFDDKITRVEISKKQYRFDKTKEPCLDLGVNFKDKTNKTLQEIELTCYAFDVSIKNDKNEKFYEILLRSWNKFMISKHKSDYCDGLLNYILAWRVRNGEEVAEIASKKIREVMIEKYSITKEETNQP